jgi:hypothetical protein
VTFVFPRDLVFEAYLNRWVNITALAQGRGLRQVDPVTYTWGMPNEQGKALAPPSTVEGVLNNTGGHWTPGNPMSDYYDYLQGRNVPTRLALRVSRDGFDNRTSAFAWLVSDTSDSWGDGSSGSGSVSVGSGVGVHTQPSAGAYVYTYLGGSYEDCQVALSMPTSSVAFVAITGAPVEPLNLMLRFQSTGTFAGEHYLLRTEIRTDNAVYVAIYHSTLGNLSGFVGPVAGLSQNVAMRAKFQIEGQSLRGKVYLAGPTNDPDQFEPLGWQVSAHHERLTGGIAGVRTGRAVGNTNGTLTASYDSWELRLVRHSGELARMQPTWEESHRIKKAAFKCADITQRLGRPERPALSSAPRRYIAKNNEFAASDYWPLDESANAGQYGLNAVTGGSPVAFLRPVVPTPHGSFSWGKTDPALAHIPAFVTTTNEFQMQFVVNQATLGASWSVSWLMRTTADAAGQVQFTTVANNQQFIFFWQNNAWTLFLNPGNITVMTGVFPSEAGTQGAWTTVSLTSYPNGANIGWYVHFNGQDMGGGSSVAASYSVLRWLTSYVAGPATGGQGDVSWSNVLVTPTRMDTVIFQGDFITLGQKVDNVLRGWPGERSGLRAFRLCAEEAVPFDYWGDLANTRPMGPQRPIPLIDQLTECAEADGALLFAPRYTPGISFRGRRSMAARAADATLSYASGHVAPRFMPSADDRPTANLVRAERIGGGFLIMEQATGPMNTKDPGTDAEAVGRSPADAKVNVHTDAQLGDVGGWVRALGTTPEIRFLRVIVNMAARELTTGVDPTAPARAVESLRVGDRLVITGMGAADVYRDLDQVVRGGTEVFTNNRHHRNTFNTAPYEKYRGAVFGDANSRYDGAVTTLDAQLTAGTTGARNVTTTAGMPWTTTAGAFPLDVLIGGERVTVSGVTGAGSAQVMTISVRNVNALPVVGGKTHPAGTRVYLYQPTYYS